MVKEGRKKMTRLKAFFLCLLSGLSCLFAQDPLSAMGDPPAKGVYDPMGWLEVSKKAELEQRFVERKEQLKAPIFVAVLPQRPSDGSESLARRLGRKWAQGETWGVILHVVGDAQSPWCAAEGAERLAAASEDEMRQATQEAMRRAFLQPDQDVRVMVGALELAVELDALESRYRNQQDLSGGSALSSITGSPGFFVQRVVVISVILLLLLIIVINVLRSNREEDRGPGYLFPETSHRSRFSGPWSGGGDALVRFTDLKPRR